MFLTKYPLHTALTLDRPNHPARGWDAKSPQFQHRTAMELFEETQAEKPREAFGVLFRLEKPSGQAPYFLIQSKVCPQHAPAGVEIKEFSVPQFEVGDVVTFKLSVNAIIRGARVTPVPLEDMDEWVANKLSGGLGDVAIITHTRDTNRDSKMAIQVDVVEGFAVVTDPEALTQMIVKGVGRAKSYGCGLLSVAKAG